MAEAWKDWTGEPDGSPFRFSAYAAGRQCFAPNSRTPR